MHWCNYLCVFLIQLTVQARDQGSPSRAASAVVNINVLRDTGVLTFTTNNYNQTISENEPVGALVTTTVASPGVRGFLWTTFSSPHIKNGTHFQQFFLLINIHLSSYLTIIPYPLFLNIWLLLMLQTSIQYSLIGLSSGPDYFSVNTNSGQVTVKRELTQDPSRLTSYRVQMSTESCSFTLIPYVFRSSYID